MFFLYLCQTKEAISTLNFFPEFILKINTIPISTTIFVYFLYNIFLFQYNCYDTVNHTYMVKLGVPLYFTLNFFQIISFLRTILQSLLR